MANLRTTNFQGFNFASGSHNGDGSGIFLFSGSMVLNPTNGAFTSYSGVGMELIGHSESYLKFHSSTSLAPGELDIRAQNFFIGDPATQFISGSGNKIEISSSKFHLQPDGDVIVGGDISASGGQIGGFNINADSIFSTNKALILSGSGNITASAGQIGGWTINSGNLLAPFGHIPGSNFGLKKGISLRAPGITAMDSTTYPRMLVQSSQNRFVEIYASGSNHGEAGIKGVFNDDEVFHLGSYNKIGGWEISESVIRNRGVELSASYGLVVEDPLSPSNNFVEMKYLAADNFGILGKTGGNTVFQLGSTNNIAGWSFDNQKLTGGKMIISQDGTIESDGFQSNVPGSGFRLTAEDGGFLEVENARIRGTLSTAVFEKETVNAVGGQLYVANSTTLTGSGELTGSTSDPGIHNATDTTMSVANVTGFAVNEVLSIKKSDGTGFRTEYVIVESSSRNDSSDEEDFSGKIMVQRGYAAGLSGDSGSLGQSGSVGQFYSGSQVIVSTGKIGTGYIRLNANPNDANSPYMQIVERFGNGVYDLDLKAQLGDLNGVTDNTFPDGVSGYGLYTTNGFFKGRVEVTNPDGTGMNHNFGGISGSTINPTRLISSGSTTGSQWFANLHTSDAHVVKNGVLFVSSSGAAGRAELRSKQQFHRNSDHTFIADVIIDDTATTNAPGFYIGLGNAPSQSIGGNHTVSTYRNCAHGVFFINNQILAVEGGMSYLGDNVTTGVAEGDTYRIIVTPQLPSGSRVQVFKHPQFSASVMDVTTTGSGPAGTGTQAVGNVFDAGIWPNQGMTSLDSTFHVDYLEVLGPGQLTTVIDGGRLTTGKIRSTNWGASQGSELDLNAGEIRLGGSANPNFMVDKHGKVTASAGKIADFDINGSKLEQGSTFNLDGSSTAEYTISSSAFTVSPTGQLSASNAFFDGFAIARSLRQQTLVIGPTIEFGVNHKYFKHGTDSDGNKFTDIYLDGSYGGEQVAHVIIAANMRNSLNSNGTVYHGNGDMSFDVDGGIIQLGAIRRIIPMTTPDGTSMPVTIQIANGVMVQLYTRAASANYFSTNAVAAYAIMFGTTWNSSEEYRLSSDNALSAIGAKIYPLASGGIYNFSISPAGYILFNSGTTNPFGVICDDDSIIRANLDVGVNSNSELRCKGDIIAFSESDINHKINITKIEHPLDKIRKISGNTFVWKDDVSISKAGKEDVGVIAQEIQGILPTIVREVDGVKSVRYEKIIPLLIECIKEQQDQIDKLKETLEDK